MAMAAADNTDRFRISTPHLTPAIPELLDRIAFSHALPGPVFRKNCNSYKPKSHIARSPCICWKPPERFFITTRKPPNVRSFHIPPLP